MEIKFIEMNDPLLGTYLEKEEYGKTVKLHLPVFERTSVPLIEDTLKLVTHIDGGDEGCLKRVFPPQEAQTYYTEDEYTRLVNDDIFIVCKVAELFNKFNKKKSLTIDISSFLSMMLATSIFDEKASFDASVIFKEKQKFWKTYTHYSTDLARCNYEEELSFQGFVDVLLELCKHLNGTDQLIDKVIRFLDSYQ
uniref:Uncharacterized protein n=1 Tax=Ciona savignyi TaxID=51511 RepID=H2ZN26_CIOSA